MDGGTCSVLAPLHEVVEVGNGVDNWEIALDQERNPHLVYRIEDGSLGGNLRYAERDARSGQWSIESILDPGANSFELAVDSTDVVHVYSSIGSTYGRRDPGADWVYEPDVPTGAGPTDMIVDGVGGVIICGSGGGDATACASRSPSGSWEQDDISIEAETSYGKSLALGPDGTVHLLVGNYVNPGYANAHAWKAQGTHIWEVEWVPEAGELSSRALAVDDVGGLHAVFSGRIDAAARNFGGFAGQEYDGWRRAGDASWTLEPMPADILIESVHPLTDGTLFLAYSAFEPYLVATTMRLARRTPGGDWTEVAAAGCNVSLMGPVVFDSCGCAHMVYSSLQAGTDDTYAVVYERVCPDWSAPGTPLGSGRCLNDTCQAQMQACRNAFCPGDGDVSSCESSAAWNFAECYSDTATDDCVDNPYGCPEAYEAGTPLIDCIRENCVSSCE